MDKSAKQHEEVLATLPAAARENDRHTAAAVPEQKATYRLIGWPENSLFFGRDCELDIMSRELLGSTGEQIRIFGLFGMPGIGKSQLALRFVHKYREKLDGIFWISADEPTRLAQGFEDMTKEPRLIGDGTSVSNETIRQKALCAKLAPCFGHLIRDYWPVGGKGRIIVTSRNLAAVEQLVTASMLIEPFNLQDGATAFLSFLPEYIRNELNARRNACTISSAYGGFPLPLHQWASFLEGGNMSIEDLSLICSGSASIAQPHSLLNTIREQDYYYYHSGNHSTIWQGPLAALSDASIFMLRLLSWFDTHSIPEVLMKPDGQLHEGLQRHLTSEVDYHLAIKSLLSQGLVNKSTHSGVFTMHRLVQAMTIQMMTVEEKRATFQLALTLLDAAIPIRANRGQFDRALPHVQRLESLRQELKIEPDPVLAYQLGSVLERTSWYALCLLSGFNFSLLLNSRDHQVLLREEAFR
ncbi:hypothetical protein GGR58DRAFT_500174 [Xylaria digitata]|nr:hypothetical protein GGR58DRAFT_500174 [Xylaria digitata]